MENHSLFTPDTNDEWTTIRYFNCVSKLFAIRMCPSLVAILTNKISLSLYVSAGNPVDFFLIDFLTFWNTDALDIMAESPSL